MNHLTASILDHGISLLAGIFAILYGYGILGGKSTESKQVGAKKLLKICGPIVVLCAVAQIIFELLRSH